MLGRSSLLSGLAAFLSASIHSKVLATKGPNGRGGSPQTGRRGPGWTNRHAQRVAAKKRAVASHRARSRGRA